MAKTIWLQTDTGKNGGQFLIDADTRKIPTVISGNSLQLFLGAFRFDRPLDLAGFERINLIIRESQTDDTPAMVDTNVLAVDVTDTVTLTAWNNRTGYNAEFNVAAGEMEYDMGDDEQRTLWMVLTAFNDTSGAETVLGSAAIIMYADNNSGSAGGAQYMLKEIYDTDGNGKVDVAELAEAVAWDDVTGKPGSFPADLTGAVRYDAAQSLDAGQQAQARSNIGAGTLSSLGTALLYSSQSLTSGQKLQALTNLGINELSLDGALRYDQAQALTTPQKEQALDNLGISGLSLDGAVLYSGPQTLNDTQKAQARDNIGAISSSNLEGAVLYDQAQALTEDEKEQARDNIGASASESSFTDRVILFRKELDTVLGATTNCLQDISWSGQTPTLPVLYAFIEASSGDLLFYELKSGTAVANGTVTVLPHDYSDPTNDYYWEAVALDIPGVASSEETIVLRKDLDTVLGATANCLQEISWSGLTPTLPVVYAFVEASSGDLRIYELKSGTATGSGTTTVLPNDYVDPSNDYYWEDALGAASGALKADGSVESTGAQTFNNILLNPSASTAIASGSVAYAKNNMVLDTEGAAASDALVAMTGASSGQFCLIRCADAARVITVTHSTGANGYRTWDEADIVLDDPKKELLTKFNGSYWTVVGYFGAPGSASLPVDDTQTLVQDPVDNTKLVRIDAGNLETATTVVLQTPGVSAVAGLIVLERALSGTLSTGLKLGFVASRPGRVRGCSAYVSGAGTYPSVFQLVHESIGVGSPVSVNTSSTLTATRKYARAEYDRAFVAGDTIFYEILADGSQDYGGSGAAGSSVSEVFVMQFEVVYDPA